MGRNPNKDKGARLEREWAAYIGGTRVAMSGSLGGGDVAGGDGPLAEFHHEVKGRKQLSIERHMQQAERAVEREGHPGLPLLAMRQDRGEWMVVMRAKDFLKRFFDYDPKKGEVDA